MELNKKPKEECSKQETTKDPGKPKTQLSSAMKGISEKLRNKAANFMVNDMCDIYQWFSVKTYLNTFETERINIKRLIYHGVISMRQSQFPVYRAVIY